MMSSPTVQAEVSKDGKLRSAVLIPTWWEEEKKDLVARWPQVMKGINKTKNRK